MKLIPSDPDLESIVRRIQENELNLQPDFQRGEIWSISKKQKLIDSILRNWYVPPIHIIVDAARGVEDVLDGQQRLVSVRDFVRGEIVVDGNIQPIDERIQDLNGLTYQQLPAEFRKIFDRFTIRIFRIFDYLPDEPYELFFRLNQSVMLTAAEQRNTFFGEAREQVRLLVSRLESRGIDFQRIGFSNSRMAYDDIVARLCIVLEYGSANVKVGANLLTDKYRSDSGFPPYVLQLAEHTIDVLSDAIARFHRPLKFNKATFFSWLYFVAEIIREGSFTIPADLSEYIERFETLRKVAKDKFGYSLSIMRTSKQLEDELRFVHEFNDRATARVWDTSSVLIRDAVLWIVLYLEGPELSLYREVGNAPKFSTIDENLNNRSDRSTRDILNRIIADSSWSAG